MSNMAGVKAVTIDIAKLGLSQLTQLKQQLDQEIELFGSSLQQLKILQCKFQDSSDCVEKITPEYEGKEVLVPLTGSMYVPGQVVGIDKLLIDVGTGYYIEKDVPATKDYLKRKIKFVSTQMEKVQHIAQEKLALRDVVVEAMEAKLQATLAAQQMASASKS